MKLTEYSKILRERVITCNGGLCAISRIVDEDRRKVFYWMARGAPLTRCPELAVLLFDDFDQRWLFNFEKIYEYEKWRGKKNNLLTIWNTVVKRAPVDKETKSLLIKL